MKKIFLQLCSVIVYLSLGIIIGLVIDKDWLSKEQQLYLDKLKSENSLLIEERQAWVRYMEEEFNQVKVYTTANHQQFFELKGIFSDIGVTLEKLPDSLAYHPDGIIVTLGEELEETYGLPLLKLDDIPKQEMDLNIMYLSLLRMKEEIMP